MKKLFLITILILLLTSLSFAQSQYVTRGQNTVGFSAGFQANSSKIPGFVSFATGFGIQGNFDLGFKIGVSDIGKIYAPYINIILQPKHKKVEIPFKFTFFVQPEFYSSSDISVKSSINVGGTIFMNNSITRKTILQLYILGAYTNGTPNGQFTKGGGISLFHKGEFKIPVLKIGFLTNRYNTSGFISLSIIIIR